MLIKVHITLRNAHITARNIVTNGVPYSPIRCGRLVGGLDWNGALERWNQPSRMNARSRGRLGPRG